MAWTDRLTLEDETTLGRIRDAHGIRPWEVYVSLALQIRISGPLPVHLLDDVMEGKPPELWPRRRFAESPEVAPYFEMRSDGCMHLKGAMS